MNRTPEAPAGKTERKRENMKEERTLVRMEEDDILGRIIRERDVRAVIIGCACVIYSSLKLEELIWVRSHYPDILNLIGEDGQPYFTVGYEADMPGCIIPDGVTFGKRTDRDGYACATVVLDPEHPDPETLIYEKLSDSLQMLGEVETMVLAILRRRGDASRRIRTNILKV